MCGGGACLLVVVWVIPGECVCGGGQLATATLRCWGKVKGWGKVTCRGKTDGVLHTAVEAGRPPMSIDLLAGLSVGEA